MRRQLISVSLGAMGLTACVSTETVTSTHIRPESIVQTYSSHCRADTMRCTNMARFRVGDHEGDTIELKDGSRVLINGGTAVFHDSRNSNRVLDALGMLTILPLFKLYKQGSYYLAAGGFESKHFFEFTDSRGHKSVTKIEVRGFAGPSSFKASRPADLESFRFRLREDLIAGETLLCVLTINAGSGQPPYSAKASAAGVDHICDFKSASASPMKIMVTDTYRLQVIRSHTASHEDSQGRQVQTHATTEMEFTGRIGS